MRHAYQNKMPKMDESVFIAPGAHVIGDVQIGQGSSIWFNTVVRGDVFPIRIGKNTNIQDNSLIHVTSGQYATQIGDEVTAGHRVILHGCEIADRVLVGMGAIIMDGAVIDEETIIGAGSLVTPGTKIPKRVLALGSPCKVIRELKPKELTHLKESALHYCQLASAYLAPM